jgi:putative holliday junction resolvase
MRYLGLDVGMRHTGVAFYDADIGISVPLPTIHHSSIKELTEGIYRIVDDRDIHELVMGLPLLPSGEEGKQANFVRICVEEYQKTHPNPPIVLIDERYTNQPNREKCKEYDTHANAAILLIETRIMRQKE